MSKMRKFFSFRSSSSSNENDNCAHADLDNSKKVHSGETQEINTKISNQKKIYAGFRTPEACILKPLNQNLQDEISSNRYIRRSLSFSSSEIGSHLRDENFGFLSEQSRVISCHNIDQHVGQNSLQCHSSFTTDGYTRSERDNKRVYATNKSISPGSFGVLQHSSDSNSTCSSSIPLRCRTTRSSSQSNVLDLYIDEEHEVKKGKNDDKRSASETEEYSKVAESRKIPVIGRPPRALSTASPSPHCSINNLLSYSFRELKDERCDHSSREWTSDDLKPAAQQEYFENYIEGTSHAFVGKSFSDIQEWSPQINCPVEDTYESSDGTATRSSADTAHGYSLDPISLDKKVDSHCVYNSPDLQRNTPFSRNGHDELVNSKVQMQDTNGGLSQMLKDLEEIYCLSHEEDSNHEKLNGSLNSAVLLQDAEVKLATELYLQIRSRLAERSLAKVSLNQSKLELNIRTRRLEKEKDELKLRLENELDRRSNEWSLKLSKFQSEEQRLRDRVRELAEQNVSLQREISWFQGSEVDYKNSLVDIEMQLNENRASQGELKTENYYLHQSLLELQGRCNEAEEKWDHLRSSLQEKERESMELQKLVGRLKRTCSEQDKTICGLRETYRSEIGKIILEGDNDVVQLQTENMRLIGVEQKLRRELDFYQAEVESMRNENIRLLNCLQGTNDGYSFSLVRLNLELHTWVESLKKQSLSLLDDSNHLCGQLLDSIACKHTENSACVKDTDEYAAIELSLKYHNLTRAIGCFRRNLQILSATLEEISSIQSSKNICQTTEIESSKNQKGHKSQDDMEVELKAEAILTRVLREKICSRELENEHLHGDLASLIRKNDLMQTDIQRLMDEVSFLNHKEGDMEIEMLKKDENLQLLQQDLQECKKDLSATRSMLENVSNERGHLWEEMKHLRETNMLMDCETKSLQKKIEMLEEDILYREGQISILKDNLPKKAFDIICSPNSLKEFNVQ